MSGNDTSVHTAASAAPSATISSEAGRRFSNRPRNPRSGRGRGRNRPVPQNDVATVESASQVTQSTRTQSSRGGRGQGRTRGATQTRSADQASRHAMTANGRQFGSRLTSAADERSGSPAEVTQVHTQRGSNKLRAAAPSFQPSQSGTNQMAMRTRQRRPSRSTAPDIATRIQEDVDNGHYECPICTNDVRRNSKVWSCRACWSVFHLNCIKKWSTNEGAAMQTSANQNGDDIPPPRQWRCPGCNLPKDDLPSTFKCWCEKETDPKAIPGLPPFSCGQTCFKPHIIPRKCPHPCPLVCHPGPCPPCNQMGPNQSCYCGKSAATRRCLDTDYEKGWSCGSVCAELMPCGEHECQQQCHEGLCGACEVLVDARCYCGATQKEIACCDRDDEKESKLLRILGDEEFEEEWTGIFRCDNLCGRQFDCGIHSCGQSCHSQDLHPSHCPWSPDVVKTCPCGKSNLDQISSTPRQSCEDRISNCTEPCLKTLPCGHPCQRICHPGECSSCREIVSIKCQCGRTSHLTKCHQGVEVPPSCTRVCHVTLNCGRHECGERCCAAEKRGTERQANKRKPRPLNSAINNHDDNIEAEHICTRVCGRLLKCGNHTCEELCHKGACGSCREAIFDEVPCSCGRTVLQPPLPCGTKPPPCTWPCERVPACGHPRVDHTCHPDPGDCPRCPFLTTKRCICGRNHLKNQKCWLSDVRCGQVCDQRLKCGSHKCRLTCHKPGECEDSGKTGGCQQACGKEKKACDHPCSATCHSPYPCKEDKACTHRIIITCTCQRLKQETSCSATKNGPGNNTKSLACDDECARQARNRVFAAALHIDPETHTDDHIPYSSETLSLFASLPHDWTQTQEKEMRILAGNPDGRRLRFKPAARAQRAFLHSLADDFGFDSESMDPEPHRHVLVFKTPRFAAAPMKTLLECQRISRRLASTPSQSTSSTTTSKISAAAPDPYNALLLTHPRFGLTIDDLTATLASSMTPLKFTISFLPSTNEVILKPLSAITEKELRAHLSALSRAFSASGTGTLHLARLDPANSNSILRRADTEPHTDPSDIGGGSGGSSGGWSRVAAKAASRSAVLPVASPRGVRNSFAVLAAGAARNSTSGAGGGKVVFAAAASRGTTTSTSTSSSKKRETEKEKESVVDDWEKAELEMEAAEEEEQLELGGGLKGEGEGEGGVEAEVKTEAEAEKGMERKDEKGVGGAEMNAEGEEEAATREEEDGEPVTEGKKEWAVSSG